MNRFLKACQRQPVDATPVWFMRQAGRYLPEYRKLRQAYTLLEICARAELVAEVTLQPVRRFDLDAAILFADILLPLGCLGLEFHFEAGEGPRIHEPVRSARDVERLRRDDPRERLAAVLEGLALVRSQLRPQVALIGFAGAPFTVASYMIEGGPSRHFVATKRFMHGCPQGWHHLMETIGEVTHRYLAAQIEAGAEAVQLFDSWVGCLGPEEYREFVLPHTRRVFEVLSPLGVPLIHFGTGTATLLELMQQAGGTVMGVDWRVPLGQAWERLGQETALQGNLDPVALLIPPDRLEAAVERVLEEAASRPGHIFNLGHGVLPETDPARVEQVVDWVHRKSQC